MSTRADRTRATQLAMQDIWDQLRVMRDALPKDDVILRNLIETVARTTEAATVCLRAVEHLERQDERK